MIILLLFDAPRLKATESAIRGKQKNTKHPLRKKVSEMTAKADDVKIASGRQTLEEEQKGVLGTRDAWALHAACMHTNRCMHTQCSTMAACCLHAHQWLHAYTVLNHGCMLHACTPLAACIHSAQPRLHAACMHTNHCMHTQCSTMAA